MAATRSAPFPNAIWRRPEDIATFLMENYPEKCVQPGEDLIAAHRRSAEVALAGRIAATILGPDSGLEED